MVACQARSLIYKNVHRVCSGGALKEFTHGIYRAVEHHLSGLENMGWWIRLDAAGIKI